MTDYTAMKTDEFIAAVGMSGEKWNDAYWQIWPEGCADRETMFGWFCNAIMAGYDSANNRRIAISDRAEELEKALTKARDVLRMMTGVNAIEQTTVLYAYCQAVEAERIATRLLTSDRSAT
jgi:ABC-type antimicrobial peptide transport system ATPase subunit